VNIKLAERLLAKALLWSVEDIRRETPRLQALSNLKYDDYHQFKPGIRFIESLVLWLRQFNKIEEKKEAYDFAMNKLIFISNKEITHLAEIAYPDYIRGKILEKASKDLLYNKYQLKKIFESKNFKEYKRKSLFIGLSDGSRIDYFRRASELNNEQVYPTYEVADSKSMDMLNELQKSLNDKNANFNISFLLDDFTASGISYARFDEEKKLYKGKIIKFLNQVFPEKGTKSLKISEIFDKEKFELHVLFYVATESALNHIKEIIDQWKKIRQLKLVYSVEAVMILRNDVGEKIKQDGQFNRLLEKYYDSSVETSHFNLGNSQMPWLGFNDCALPLILNHNTPNNSLVILWYEGEKSKALFPRINRHKDERL
jgi:hypothetical protein